MDTIQRRAMLLATVIMATLLVPASSQTAGVAAPATAPYASSMLVDWTTGIIRAEVELDLAGAGIRLPSGRSLAERQLGLAVPDLVRQLALDIGLDSWRSVSDSLDDGTLDPSVFEVFLESGRLARSSLSRDLGRLLATYEWKLADLGALYVRHSVPMKLPSPDRYMPTRDYSGIIIYVQGVYDVRGEHRTERIRPCLFPRLYDEAMTPILERNAQDPAALRMQGAVAYATSLDDPVIEGRAGDDPLRMIATQIFGSHRTDVIIRTDDALKILGSEANRDLIRLGKVVFVIDES